MTFFKHTESWFKGEAFEAGMLIIFGALLVILALYFWKFGFSPSARALVIPFLLVGAFWSVVPAAGLYRNAARVEAYRAAYQNNPAAWGKSTRPLSKSALESWPYSSRE